MTEDYIVEQAKLSGFFFQDAGYSSQGILHTQPLQYSQKCFVRFANRIQKQARIQALEESAQCSEDTVTALSGLPDVDRLIKLGDDIAFNIRRMKGQL